MSNKNILAIVDDDDIFKYTFNRLLKLNGIKDGIITFSNGKELLEFLLENKEKQELLPDVIFLDINMPVMTGFDFLESYEGLNPQIKKPIKIYMVSSSIDKSDIERALSFNAVEEYITKPMNQEKIKILLNKVSYN